MINRLLHSGKFWLKIIFFSLLTTLLMVVGLYASLYHLFTPERIQQFAETSLQGTQRHIRFDADIGRHWFPRPTVTLKNITISRPNSKEPAIYIQESKIGIAWQSLWQKQPLIEKWVVSGATAMLEYRPDGRWNLQDLWQHRPSGQLNRLIIENSRLYLRVGGRQMNIDQFGLNTRSPDSDGRRFSISGTLQYAGWPLKWQGSGSIRTTGSQWQIPAFYWEAQGRLNDKTLQISTDSIVNWHPASGILRLSNLALRADSSYQNLHLTAHIPAITFKNNRLYIDTLSSAFTAGTHEQQWDGALKFDKANLHHTFASLDSFELSVSHRNSRLQTNFSATGALDWTAHRGIQSNHLNLTTLQDNVGQTPRPRFISLLEGSLQWQDPQHWQGRFQGFFDRQPTAISIQYRHPSEEPALLEAGIAIRKLNMAPYWNDLQAQAGDIYPEWLDYFPKIEAQLQLDDLTLPGLQLNNVSTLISADREHIAFTHFKAGLYGGQTEGGISMANTVPVSYHLQQNAQGVQIRPLLQDLFGFHSFSGTGEAVIDVTTKGADRKSLLTSLDGTLTLNVADGAWHGIDMNNILQSGHIAQNTDTGLQTPFQHFTLNGKIEKGISHHINTELFSDRLHVISSGFTDLNTQSLSEDLLIYNARRPDLRPVPIKIRGSVYNPSVTLDYSRLTDELTTPEEKQKALQDTLQEQWKWLMPHPQ